MDDSGDDFCLDLGSDGSASPPRTRKASPESEGFDTAHLEGLSEGEEPDDMLCDDHILRDSIRLLGQDLDEAPTQLPSSQWDAELSFLDDLFGAEQREVPRGAVPVPTLGVGPPLSLSPKLEELLSAESLYPMGPLGSKKEQLKSKVMHPSPIHVAEAAVRAQKPTTPTPIVLPELPTPTKPRPKLRVRIEDDDYEEELVSLPLVNRPPSNAALKAELAAKMSAEEISEAKAMEARARARFGELGPEAAALVQKPLQLGWAREVVWRSANDGSADVYYYTPGRKHWFRGQKATMDHVDAEWAELGRANFCFLHRTLGWDGPEEWSRMSSRHKKMVTTVRPKFKKLGKKRSMKRNTRGSTLKLAKMEAREEDVHKDMDLSPEERDNLLKQILAGDKGPIRPQKAMKSIGGATRRREEPTIPVAAKPVNVVKPRSVAQEEEEEEDVPLLERLLRSSRQPLKESEATSSATSRRPEVATQCDGPLRAPSGGLGGCEGGFRALLAVLGRLPPPQLLKARLVSRTWNDLASAPSLWKSVCLSGVAVRDWGRAAEFLGQRSTKRLDVRGVRSSAAAFEAVLPRLSFLEALDCGDIVNSLATRVLTSAFAPNLTSFGGRLIGDGSSSGLAGLTETETVEFDATQLQTMGKLKQLKLSAPLRSLFLLRPQALASMKHLVQLHLFDVFGQMETTLESLCKCESLRVLHIGSCEDWTPKTYSLLASLSGLSELSLEAAAIDAVALNCLAQLLRGSLRGLCLRSLEVVDFPRARGPPARTAGVRLELWPKADEPDIVSRVLGFIPSIISVPESIHIGILSAAIQPAPIDTCPEGASFIANNMVHLDAIEREAWKLFPSTAIMISLFASDEAHLIRK